MVAFLEQAIRPSEQLVLPGHSRPETHSIQPELSKAVVELTDQDKDTIARNTFGSSQHHGIYYPEDGAIFDLESSGHASLEFVDTGDEFKGNDKKTLGKTSQAIFHEDGSIAVVHRNSRTALTDTITVSPAELSFSRRSEARPKTNAHDIVVFPRMIPTDVLTSAHIAEIAERTHGLALGKAIHYGDQKVRVKFVEAANSSAHVSMEFFDDEGKVEGRRKIMGTMTLFAPDGTIQFISSPSRRLEPRGSALQIMKLGVSEKRFGRFFVTPQTNEFVMKSAEMAEDYMLQKREEASQMVGNRVVLGNNR